MIKFKKTYYIPLITFHSQDTAPIIFSNIVKIREIILSEDINTIHFHQVS